MNDLQDQVIVPVQMEEIDLRRANFWFVVNQPSFKGFLILFLLVVIAGFVVNESLLIILPALTLATFLLVTPLVVYFNTKRIFSDLKDFQKDVVFTFSDAELESNNERAHGNAGWDSYIKAVESKHSFNLFIQRRLFIVVPKRFIKSSSDLNRVREILKNNFGDKVKLQNRSAKRSKK